MILVILVVSALTRIWYTLQPMLLWWDAAMYIGMGKYIFSGGSIGIFEIYRPLGIPLILGTFWKLGLDPLVWGKIFSVAASVIAIYYVYRIGEKIHKHTGVYAATLFSFTAVFFAYTSAPLSDIPSVAIALGALYAFLNKKYYWSGFLIGAAFLTRFPMALMLITLSLSVLLLSELSIKERVYKALWIGTGFATLAIPYFILNMILYGNPLLPIILGNQVAENAARFYDPHTFLFYIKGLFVQNPFIIFALGIFIPFFVSSQKHLRSSLIPVIVPLLIIGGYFSANSHQELRYSISFLPFLCIAAGYGISILVHTFPGVYKHTISATLITLTLLGICHEAYQQYNTQFRSTPQLEAFHGFFRDIKGARIITTSPQMTAYADIHLVDAYDTWEKANKIYTERSDEIEYFALNDCAMICDREETCPYAKNEFYKKIEALEKVFSEMSQSCTLTIYKIKK